MDRTESVKVFLGEMPNANNHYRVSLFEQKHLKSYLRGDKTFSFGKHIDGSPMIFNVKYEYMSISQYYAYLGI